MYLILIKNPYRISVEPFVLHEHFTCVGLNCQRHPQRHPGFSFLFFVCCPDAGPLTHSGTTELLYVCLLGLLGLFSAGPNVELPS